MRKKHPIRNFLLLLLAAAIVAGLAAMPMLTAGQAEDKNAASILSGTPERRDLYKRISSGAPLAAPQSEDVRVPSGVRVTEYLIANGDEVTAGTPVARVDDVSVMTAVKSVQDSLDTISKQLQTVRAKIEPGVISVNSANKLCVNGKQIEQSKLSSYTQFITLSQQHREYEELLLELFRLHQSGVAAAPIDGVIGSLDKTQLKPLSASGEAVLMPLAANTPAGDDSEIYNGFVRVVMDIKDGYWHCRTGTEPAIITDFLNLKGISTAVSENIDLCLPEVVFAYSGEEWNLIEVQPGDLLLYAYAHDGSYWVIRIGRVNISPEEPTEPTESPEHPTLPTEPEETAPSEPDENPEDPENPENPEDPTAPTTPGGGGGNRPGGMPSIDWGSLSGMIGSRGGSGSGNSQASNLHSTAEIILCTVTPADTVTMALPIDEMDIAALQVGMTAEVSLEALPNRKYEAVITAVSPFGSNAGGSSKFTVTLEMPRVDGMLPGMNAAVTITLDVLQNCLTVPVAALAEQGNRTILYTGYDEKDKTLLNPATVTLGYSDGESVQLLAGLSEGQTFWYSYYDTVEISNAVESRGMFG